MSHNLLRASVIPAKAGIQTSPVAGFSRRRGEGGFYATSARFMDGVNGAGMCLGSALRAMCSLNAVLPSPESESSPERLVG
jgi:hypothetical protein